jgi:flavorubredoxin
MIPMEIKSGVISLRSNHWDRKLFDEFAPLPDGTSYNAYLVQGAEKTALIDTVHPHKTAELVAALRAMRLARIDYIVANHAEQDHCGSIPAVLELFPEAKVVTNARCWRMMCDAMPLNKSSFQEVKDGDRLPLGGKTLEFAFLPWVHWPETMGTFLQEDGIVFPCDFLGSHLATGELFATDEARTEVAAKRYYAEIMMPYRPHAKNALERVTKLAPKIIAPSHGPVYGRPAFITELYGRWTSDEVKPEVVIPYVSMYQSTSAMVEHLADRLMEKHLPVQLFNAVELDTGALSMALVDASTVVFASPAFLVGPHPAMAYAATLVNALLPKTRYAALIGSYGWGTTMPDMLMEMLKEFKATFFEPVLSKGSPKPDTFEALDQLASAIAEANFSPAAAGEAA